MQLGDVVNAMAAGNGKPLDGVRVLAVEQMQALPYATQLLARLGADVVKVERPGGGELARSSQPAMPDPAGSEVGATFPRPHPPKRSLCLDLPPDARRRLLRHLARRSEPPPPGKEGVRTVRYML